MKDSYPSISLARFCRLLGITRQAFYQHFWHVEYISTDQQLVLEQIKQIRQEHPVKDILYAPIFFIRKSDQNRKRCAF